MRYILVGLAFGLAWAGMQYARGEITDPVALAGPVILFAVFGAILWGIRVIVLLLRGRQHK